MDKEKQIKRDLKESYLNFKHSEKWNLANSKMKTLENIYYCRKQNHLFTYFKYTYDISEPKIECPTCHHPLVIALQGSKEYQKLKNIKYWEIDWKWEYQEE